MQNQTQRICFIVNPAANRHRSLRNVEWLRHEASKLWESYEIVIARNQDSLAKLTKEKSRIFDVIVACGGDGTVSQVINGLVHTNAVLGVLPIGSGNDFEKSIGLDKPLPDCLNILKQNHITEIDLIRYEGDVEGWCANTIGFGLDGWANYYARQMPRMRGKVAYFYGALKAILKFRGSEMEINLPDGTKKGTYVMVTACNGKWEGGSFLIAPDADMQDGFFELLSIRKISVIPLVTYLLQFRWGPARWMKAVEKNQTTSAELSSSLPLAVHRDGEHLGTDIRRLKLTVKKNALKVIAPARY